MLHLTQAFAQSANLILHPPDIELTDAADRYLEKALHILIAHLPADLLREGLEPLMNRPEDPLHRSDRFDSPEDLLHDKNLLQHPGVNRIQQLSPFQL